jgi:hypothetical protein
MKSFLEKIKAEFMGYYIVAYEAVSRVANWVTETLNTEAIAEVADEVTALVLGVEAAVAALWHYVAKNAADK